MQNRLKWLPLTALAVFGFLYLSAERQLVPRMRAGEVQQNCNVVPMTDGSTLAGKVCINEDVTVALTAQYEDPTLTAECPALKRQWSWAVTKVESGTTAMGPWMAGALAGGPTFDPAAPSNTPRAKLKVKFGSAGFWRITVSVTGNWTSEGCGGCSKTSTLTIGPVEVVDGCELRLTPVYPDKNYTVCPDKNVTFTAQGACISNLNWSTNPPGNPATGTGATFTTKWSDPGEKTVTLSNCGPNPQTAKVTVRGGEVANAKLDVSTPTTPTQMGGPDNFEVVSNWSVDSGPADTVVVTHLSLNWNISEADPTVSPQLSNGGSEDFFFLGAPTGLKVNLFKDGGFNDSRLWIDAHLPPGFAELSDAEKTRVRKELFEQYVNDWIPTHYTTRSSMGAVTLSAEYRLYACVDPGEFTPPIPDEGSRDRVLPGYPYGRIPNVERKMYRRSFPHTAAAPSVWLTPAIKSATVNVNFQYTNPPSGQFQVMNATP